MNSVWRSLLWKEWREYRWKLAVLSVAILLPPFLLTAWIDADSLEVFIHILLGTLFCYGFLAGMFLGMGVAARENGVGTTPFLQSLPTPMWKAAAAKLFVASVTAATPIMLLIVISYGCYRSGFFFVENFSQFFVWRIVDPGVPGTVADCLLSCLFVAVVCTLSLLWWTAALGVDRSDEIRAGAVAFLGIVAIWFCGGYLYHLSAKYDLRNLKESLELVAAAAPAGPLTQFNPDSPWPIAQKSAYMSIVLSMIGLIGHAGVLGWFLYRFGRVSPKTGRGDELQSETVVAGSLKAPFKSQLTAIAWKQMRETGPLAVVALAGILGMATLILWVDDSGSYTFKKAFLHVGAGMSFFVVLVAGIGIYLDDLKPGLSNFWRSRPTDLRLWFGIKYAAGILTLAIVLGIPMLVAGTIHWNEYAHPDQANLWLGSLFVAWLFVTVFSLAMTAQCLVRQPIYAVVLTLTAMWLGAFVFYRVFGNSPPVSVTVMAMVLALAAVIALAWKTVERDWGWKH